MTMNIDNVKRLLAGASGVSAWLLRRVVSDATTVIRLPGIYTAVAGRFVRQPNPHPREVIHAPGEELWLSVWSRHSRDGNDHMGEATGQLLSDEPAQVATVVAALVAAAQSQPNRPHSLPGGSLAFPKVALADSQLIDAARPALLGAVQRFGDGVIAAAAAEESVEVSNIEVFVRRFDNRVETSSGIAAGFRSTRTDAEVCFIARAGDQVAEHTARPHARRFEDLDVAVLVREAAQIARGIVRAGAPPSHSGTVVLAGEAAQNFLALETGPLGFHAGARMVYEKMARYERGKPASGGEFRGDRLTLFSDPLVDYGPNSQPLSVTDGGPTGRVALLSGGCFDGLLGGWKYYDYLGLIAQGKLPPGQPGNTVVTAGRTKALDLLDSGRTVVVRAFSDFRVDPASGEFASEVRLGEVREGGRAAPFKGGLLIGNWFTALGDITLSAETTAGDGYYGPSVVRIGGLQLAG